VFHHVTLEVSDLERSASFYDALLAPIGWRRQVDGASEKGWGIVKPLFFITQSAAARTGGVLVSFGANGIAGVKGAYEGAIEAGGISESEPAQRTEKSLVYYSAFINDPDGHRLEVAVLPD
jgi:catechol 2,3-dioxygenase-like lactoylglutathione lyase family enzyme